jgi:hypothetical protein
MGAVALPLPVTGAVALPLPVTGAVALPLPVAGAVALPSAARSDVALRTRLAEPSMRAIRMTLSEHDFIVISSLLMFFFFAPLQSAGFQKNLLETTKSAKFEIR